MFPNIPEPEPHKYVSIYEFRFANKLKGIGAGATILLFPIYSVVLLSNF
jgi:hypothetical protein